MSFQLDLIKQRMRDAGIEQEEIDCLVQPFEKELERRVCGLVWKREGATSSLIEEMRDKLPILKMDASRNIIMDAENGINHVLIEGENLLALMAMQYTHVDQDGKGKIDVIYIDPPYNTGSVTFDYNDKFEKSEWLSMMNVRLRLARNLLTPQGAIFISIDEHYQAELKMLCDDVFQASNYLGTIHWRRRHNQPNDKKKLIGVVTEFIFAYSNDLDAHKEYGIGKIPLTGKYQNPDNDPRGPWTTTPWKSSGSQSGCTYEIVTPAGNHFVEEWLGTKETYEEHLRNGNIYFPKDGKGIPRKKIYQRDREDEGQCASNWWDWSEFGSNQDATDLLKDIFNTDATPFNNPKPVKLIKRIIGLASVNKNAVILDFYGGSGTTLQAAMELNLEDGGHRQCIICTNNELGAEARKKAEEDQVTPDMPEWENYGVCHAITYPRLRTVITGKRMDGTEFSKGMKGNNLYYYQITSDLKVASIERMTLKALAKQAVPYVVLKENLFVETKHKDYTLLSSADTEVMVVTNYQLDEEDVREMLIDGSFSKNNRKVYCKVAHAEKVDDIWYLPYPEEILNVLKVTKKRMAKELKG